MAFSLEYQAAPSSPEYEAELDAIHNRGYNDRLCNRPKDLRGISPWRRAFYMQGYRAAEADLALCVRKGNRLTRQALTARKLAIVAYRSSSPLATKLLDKAEQIDVWAVASLEAEMELAGAGWEDTIEYPHLPQYEVIARAFKDGEL